MDPKDSEEDLATSSTTSRTYGLKKKLRKKLRKRKRPLLSSTEASPSLTTSEASFKMNEYSSFPWLSPFETEKKSVYNNYEHNDYWFLKREKDYKPIQDFYGFLLFGLLPLFLLLGALLGKTFCTSGFH